MATGLMNMTEFGKHIGVCRQRVAKYIEEGKIPAEAWEFVGKRKMINPQLADKRLEGSLSQYRKINPRPPRGGQFTATHEKAYEWALEGDHIPIIVSLRYIIKLAELMPEAVKISFPENGQGGVLITTLNPEGEPPWAETISINHFFDDHEDLEAWDRDFGLPEWAWGQAEEIRERLEQETLK